jgi:hypothetical protein
LKQFKAQGFGKPSIRAMFYRLYGRGLIPNIGTAYNQFDSKMVKARESGEIPMDAFVDNTRRVIKDFRDISVDYKKLIDLRIEDVEDTIFDYNEYTAKWKDQPHYVEVWYEKQAMSDIFRSVLTPYRYDVRLVAIKGNDSLSNLWQSVLRLALAMREHKVKQVHILYFGDFDPSGSDMDRDLKERMTRYFLKLGIDFQHEIDRGRLDFHRVAITKEQIKKYDLPWKPDDETAMKMLKKDRRTARFLEEHKELMSTELDTLPAVIPDVFKKMVKDEIEKYFDKKIDKNLMKKHTQDDVVEYLKESIEDLARRWSSSD